MKNTDIIEAWMSGKKSGQGQWRLHTDGKSLFSYQLRIGRTESDGKKIAFNYTAKGPQFYSTTTSRHCYLAIRHGGAAIVWNDTEDEYERKITRAEFRRCLMNQTRLPVDVIKIACSYM